MHLEIITPEKKVFSGEIKSAVLPGTEGKFGILNKHASMISTLKKGKIKVVDAQQQIHTFEINGGVAEMHANNLTVLAE